MSWPASWQRLAVGGHRNVNVGTTTAAATVELDDEEGIGEALNECQRLGLGQIEGERCASGSYVV